MNETIKYQNYPKGNRRYKDTVFKRAFAKKKDLLELYNAVNGTAYQNEEDLIINTLQDAVYMCVKNDVSFIIDCRMNLYEHQSSVNPNMPLRGLLYFSKMYETYVELRKIDVYSSTLQKIPTPRYIVFYNGTKEEPDKKIYRLSEAFENGEGCLECEATMLNINYGRNRELMEKCQRLEEYAQFVEIIRRRIKQGGMKLEIAIMNAIDECIKKGILKDVLEKQKAEVVSLVLTTFNKELYESNLKKDAYSEGETAGYSKGEAAGYSQGKEKHLKGQVEKKLAKGKSVEEIADELEEELKVVRQIVEKITKK